MEVFLLGAGRPAIGSRPAALRYIAASTRALDWQIHSFEAVACAEDIHFLGGYHVEEVIQNYPLLNVTVVPDWDHGSILHTLSKAPFSGGPVLIAYSDTVFRPDVMKSMLASNADVVYAIDSCWEHRYEKRTVQDAAVAEIIKPGELSSLSEDSVEFTGLIYLSDKAARRVFSDGVIDRGDNLLDLLGLLDSGGLSVAPHDVAGNWAEFNSPDDVARFILGTKADTLARLAPQVTLSVIGKQVALTSAQWSSDYSNAIRQVQATFSGQPLVVRSSSKLEDSWTASNAGGFESILNVDSGSAIEIRKAVEAVLDSYGESVSPEDQVLVQEFVGDVSAAGVVFTCSLETGAPYYRFNFDDKTSSTDSVTSGAGIDLRTVVLSRYATEGLSAVEPTLVPVLAAIRELEQLLGFDKLDVEFAIDSDGIVHIFQVRPITVDHSNSEIDAVEVEVSLSESSLHFRRCQAAHPQVVGERTLFANMPDWNPAEIIGTRPRPLAFSLYRHLITDEIWARQRREYGYRDVSPQPLISMFSGQPYVDVRASLNSFIPASVPDETAGRLVDAYLKVLAEHPEYHDKLEFDVAFTMWTPDLRQQAIERLSCHGISHEDIDHLELGLLETTRNALQRLGSDTDSIEILTLRRERVMVSYLPPIERYLALLDDCRRFGTLAFSHAARAGFVGTTILRWLVREGILTEERLQQFLCSFSTVAGEFEKAKRAFQIGEIAMADLVAGFGHLRPGTYDVTQKAYWEDCEKYFADSRHSDQNTEHLCFEFSVDEGAAVRDFLSVLGSSVSSDDLFTFVQEAIQARESVKFEFSKNLSRALDAARAVGEELCIDREGMSYLCHEDLVQLKLNQLSPGALPRLIRSRQRESEITHMVELPPLIKSVEDIYCFERMSHQPNFVTNGKVEADVVKLESGKDLQGKVVVIPQADPGFDWLFGQHIGGLITQFGGANSHMAIRSAEMGLPAAIGVGEQLYQKVSSMNKVLLDCANQTIREVQ